MRRRRRERAADRDGARDIHAQGKALSLLVLLLERSGGPKLTDFGAQLAILAAVTGEDDTEETEAATEGEVLAVWAEACRNTSEQIDEVGKSFSH